MGLTGLVALAVFSIDHIVFGNLWTLLVSSVFWLIVIGIVYFLRRRTSTIAALVWIFFVTAILDFGANVYKHYSVAPHANLGLWTYRSPNLLPDHLKGPMDDDDLNKLTIGQLYERKQWLRRQQYANELRAATNTYALEAGWFDGHFAKRNLPFVSVVSKVVECQQYSIAIGRLESGTPESNDFSTIAATEHNWTKR